LVEALKTARVSHWLTRKRASTLGTSRVPASSSSSSRQPGKSPATDSPSSSCGGVRGVRVPGGGRQGQPRAAARAASGGGAARMLARRPGGARAEAAADAAAAAASAHLLLLRARHAGAVRLDELRIRCAERLDVLGGEGGGRLLARGLVRGCRGGGPRLRVAGAGRAPRGGHVRAVAAAAAAACGAGPVRGRGRLADRRAVLAVAKAAQSLVLQRTQREGARGAAGP
jgi:hypothetical protein